MKRRNKKKRRTEYMRTSGQTEKAQEEIREEIQEETWEAVQKSLAEEDPVTGEVIPENLAEESSVTGEEDLVEEEPDTVTETAEAETEASSAERVNRDSTEPKDRSDGVFGTDGEEAASDAMAESAPETNPETVEKTVEKAQAPSDRSCRRAEVIRNTKETRIRLSLNLDGQGKSNINTGIGFFDHMLEGFAKHGFFDLETTINGDLNVDGHHTVEDCGIVLGNAIREAVGDKKGIGRYGSMILPMDDALVLCALDLCGRPYLSFDAEFPTERIGYLDTELIREFFYAVSYGAMMNLHIKVISGINSHHIAEAMFKAFARALDQAVTPDARITDVLSTKGVL